VGSTLPCVLLRVLSLIFAGIATAALLDDAQNAVVVAVGAALLARWADEFAANFDYDDGSE
jgi:hypothetical protein